MDLTHNSPHDFARGAAFLGTGGGGPYVGRPILQHIDGGEGHMDIDFRYEFLCAKVGERIAAMAPDLICVLDRETAEPIAT